MKKYQEPNATCVLVPASHIHEAVVILHTRRDHRYRVEYQTPDDLLWSINDLLGRRRVPHTVTMQGGAFFSRYGELMREGGVG